MRISHRLLSLPIFLLGACYVGTSARNYAPAKGPAGAMLELDLEGARKAGGELLAVEDSTLLLLVGRNLVRLPMSQVKHGRAPKLSFSRDDLRGEKRYRLRLISRYPQGLTPELEARLLEAYGADSVRAAR